MVHLDVADLVQEVIGHGLVPQLRLLTSVAVTTPMFSQCLPGLYPKVVTVGDVVQRMKDAYRLDIKEIVNMIFKACFFINFK